MIFNLNRSLLRVIQKTTINFIQKNSAPSVLPVVIKAHLATGSCSAMDNLPGLFVCLKQVALCF